MYCEIDVFRFLVLEDGDTNYLIKSGLQIYRCLYIRDLLHVFELGINPVKSEGCDEFRIVWVDFVLNGSTKEKPAVIELLQLVWIHGVFFWHPPKHGISETDHLFSGNGRK